MTDLYSLGLKEKDNIYMIVKLTSNNMISSNLMTAGFLV